MHKKSEIVQKLEELNEITWVNRRMITGITTIQSDSEAVSVKGEAQRYCINDGMVQEKAPPFVHQMNGLIESAIKAHEVRGTSQRRLREGPNAIRNMDWIPPRCQLSTTFRSLSVTLGRCQGQG